MRFESWPKAEKTPNEIQAELTKEGKRLLTAEEVSEMKKKEADDRVPRVSGFERPDNLRIKKWNDMTQEEREARVKKHEGLLTRRPEVRI